MRADFNLFIEGMNLIDLPLRGRKFTWVRPNGSQSRLDRFLVSEGWLEAWGEVSQWALNRDIFDHYPIILSYSTQNRSSSKISGRKMMGLLRWQQNVGLRQKYMAGWVSLCQKS